MKISGTVKHGSRIGRGLGYPTANIHAGDEVGAADGVYAATAEYSCEKYGAMVNLGVKPTVSDNMERTLEIHLFGFEGDLYGKTISVELIEFVRPEQKFDSREKLRAQIEKDRQTIIEILKGRKCI